jgi:hypothetical protein
MALGRRGPESGETTAMTAVNRDQEPRRYPAARDPADGAVTGQSLQAAIVQWQKARELLAASALAKLYRATNRAPMRTECSCRRSRASRRPNNSPNSLRRKPFSRRQALRSIASDEPIMPAAAFAYRPASRGLRRGKPEPLRICVTGYR